MLKKALKKIIYLIYRILKIKTLINLLLKNTSLYQSQLELLNNQKKILSALELQINLELIKKKENATIKDKK